MRHSSLGNPLQEHCLNKLPVTELPEDGRHVCPTFGGLGGSPPQFSFHSVFTWLLHHSAALAPCFCTTVYKCLHGGAPPYLVEMMLPVTDTPALRRLRSATRGDLIIPSSKTVRFGPRSFNVSRPTLWNSLPVNIRQCKSFESFKKQLKTFLYLRANCM